VQELVERRVADGEWLFSARHEVEYLNETYDLGIPESEEYDTLAGYIIAEYGGLPTEGEDIDVQGYRITIVKREQSRLELIKLKRVE
jgi:CBS domain containing-hemolysin-like protein